MIKSRIIELLESQNISKYKFYKDTGVSNGYLDKKGSIGEDLLVKIAVAYPNLDMNWLVTGVEVGETPDEYMFKKVVVDENGTKYQDKAVWYADRYLKKDNELSEANAKISELEAVVGYLEGQLKKCRESK